ncbi:MAG TPA: MFS transporter [Pyrinomonadaceae bacterium]|jgi:MFS family permease|nr:MFS transporter [Pyrinomonadaceae bacterium]
MAVSTDTHRPIELGLRVNIQQFSLLVLINAFVGGMVGVERTILPLIAEQEFGLASKSAILSFIVSFGIVKAIANLLAGKYSDVIGRKKLLVAGWLFGLPVPFILMWAPSWGWVTAANILLGINQGLCWSTTVIMKIDLVGPKRRGFAMGLNEFAGYGAVALAALASGYLASTFGLRPVPFYLGIAFAIAGLILSLTLVRDTKEHAILETRAHQSTESKSRSFSEVFAETSFRNPTLFSISQAGLVNNLNDGMTWGLFPLLLSSYGLSVGRIGILAATYPAVWAVAQIATGALSDRWGRKWMIALGMWIQAVAIWLIASAPTFGEDPVYRFLLWISGAVLLGLGTALVYPTLLAAIGDVVHPGWRASAVGVYRLWRDLGYAVGALLSGIVADAFGIVWAVTAVGVLTFGSGIVVALRMRETSDSRIQVD